MARAMSHTVASEGAGMRLDALLAAQGLYGSRSLAARLIDEGRVFVNGESKAKSHVVCEGDLIVYEEAEAALETRIAGQDIALDIRFEDDSLLVLSKQAGLVCHPSADHHDGTLVNALVFHCGIGNLCNVQGSDERLGIVHRLDRDTTGLMLAAKTDQAGLALMDAIRDREVDRRYLALVQGSIAHDSGMIDAPIARSIQDRTRMTVRDGGNARDSVTTFKVLERFEAGARDNGYTLLECKLMTGRTHQIRVHMNYIRHPCVGDPVYGGGGPGAQLGLGRQFLHSWRLDFTHPLTGEPMRFTDPLPSDLEAVLDGLEGRSLGRTDAGKSIEGFKASAVKGQNACEKGQSAFEKGLGG
ncbi:MAG: RluA family pseudouridine synthase [Coriobacteriaceae bacterium]|jgi:23S rRNA pseudouridine1911/1915/1917 synthase|nr:RluA family pseudouridine synthase [Coriobacteriaceae bacterium]